MVLVDFDELQLLSGSKQISKVCRFLDLNSIPYVVGSDGKPRTTKDILNEGIRNGKEDEREDEKNENTTKGKAPTRPPKCVAFAFGADVLVSSLTSSPLFSFFENGFSRRDDEDAKMVKEALRETLTFWATEAECESMVLYRRN